MIVYLKELEHQLGGIYFSDGAKYIVSNITLIVSWEDPEMVDES